MGFLYWHICCYRRKLTDAELEACYRYDKQFWEHYSKKCRWPIRNVPREHHPLNTHKRLKFAGGAALARPTLERNCNELCPFVGLISVAPSGIYNLNHTLRQHRIGNLHKTGNVRALHVVGLLTFTTMLNTGMVDIQHDVMQTCVNFLGFPAGRAAFCAIQGLTLLHRQH